MTLGELQKPRVNSFHHDQLKVEKHFYVELEKHGDSVNYELVNGSIPELAESQDGS